MKIICDKDCFSCLLLALLANYPHTTKKNMKITVKMGYLGLSNDSKQGARKAIFCS